MGLDDLLGGNNSTGGNKPPEDEPSEKKYVQPDVDDMEEFFSNRPENWELLTDDPSGEIVVQTKDFIPKLDRLTIRCYTTIDKKTKKAREKGSDAIRLVIWDSRYNNPIGGRKKTLRITTWRKNLSKKIDELMRNGEQYLNFCDECNGLMVRREGKYGEFLGCENYPFCKNTRQIDD